MISKIVSYPVSCCLYIYIYIYPLGFRPREIAPKPGFGPFLGNSNPVKELTGNSTSKLHNLLKIFTLNKLRPLAYSETYDLFKNEITLALITQKGNLYLYHNKIYGYHNKSSV